MDHSAKTRTNNAVDCGLHVSDDVYLVAYRRFGETYSINSSLNGVKIQKIATDISPLRYDTSPVLERQLLRHTREACSLKTALQTFVCQVNRMDIYTLMYVPPDGLLVIALATRSKVRGFKPRRGL